MVKLIFSDKAREQLNNLKFNIEDEIKEIINFLPKQDVVGLNHIYITDVPEKWKAHLANSAGSYYQKHKNSPAYIELYLKRLLGDIKSAKQLSMTLPIHAMIMAKTIFHEVGHHIEQTRSHGVKKGKKERFADEYAENRFNKYIVRSADSIKRCFDELEKVSESIGLPSDSCRNIRANWEQIYIKATAAPE